MSKSTISLSDVLINLTSPMEKTAEMKEGKTDALEDKATDAGCETPAEVKVEGDKPVEKKKEKEETEVPTSEDKDSDEYKKGEMDKEASIKAAAASITKTASTTTETPVSGLEKIAADLAEVEHRTMVKEASVFGSVMADSFANRLAEIQTVLDDSTTMDKTAMEKTSAEEVYMEKVATELYHTMDREDAELVNTMVKTAADEGYQISPEQAFSALADEAIAMGEQAAFQKTAADEAMTKLASDDHAKIDGFVKTAALMGEQMTKTEAFTYLAKTAMENGANIAREEAIIEKTAAASVDTELNAMEKVASEMAERGDTAGVAALEKHAYDKGFEETLVKVAAHTSGIGYTQTEALMN